MARKIKLGLDEEPEVIEINYEKEWGREIRRCNYFQKKVTALEQKIGRDKNKLLREQQQYEQLQGHYKSLMDQNQILKDAKEDLKMIRVLTSLWAIVMTLALLIRLWA